jgi:putative peptidoglycan lipid II flippase
MAEKHESQFERHARTVTILTALSRFGGLARDATMSRVFGVGPLMDAFAFGFMVPNLFRRLFGEGALSAAFLPAFTRGIKDDVGTARYMAWLLISRATVLLSALVLVAEGLLLWGVFDHTLESNGIRLLAIMLPYAPMVCMVALIGSMLQAYGRFGPTAAAPIVLNLLLVGSTLALEPLVASEVISRESHVAWVAGSVLLTGVIQLVWVLLALRKVMPRSTERDVGQARRTARKVGLQALPMILGLGVLQFNTLLDGLIASWPTLVGPTVPFLDVAYPLPEGSMASLSWAARLYEFPLGVFGIAIATAIFPQLAREHGDERAFSSTLRRGIRMTLFIGLPASIGVILVREPLTAVVLQGYSFTATDTRWVAFILLGYATAIWAYCLTQLFVRAFYARGETMTPVKVAVAMVALNLLLNLTLIWTPLKVAGLAWSTAICAVIQTFILAFLLHRRMDGLLDASVFRGLLATLWVTLATGIGAAVTYHLFDPSAQASNWWYQLIVLVAVVAAGGFAALLTARLFRMPELGWLLGSGHRS